MEPHETSWTLVGNPGQPSPRKSCLVHTVCDFWAHTSSFENEAAIISLDPSVVNFFGLFHDKLFVRQAYRDLHELVERCYVGLHNHVIASGTPGTGKSYFLVYELYRAHQAGREVVVQGSNAALFSSKQKSVFYLEDISPSVRKHYVFLQHRNLEVGSYYARALFTVVFSSLFEKKTLDLWQNATIKCCLCPYGVKMPGV